MPDLFDTPSASDTPSGAPRPLADRLRPRTLPDVIGQDHILGPDLAGGARPQIVVPASHWQAAHAPDGWTLVGCTVSPGFRFEGFELAAPGFDIPRG